MQAHINANAMVHHPLEASMGALVVNGTMTVAGLVGGVMWLRELAQMHNKAHSILICFGPDPHVRGL